LPEPLTSGRNWSEDPEGNFRAEGGVHTLAWLRDDGVEHVKDRYGVSERWVHERTRLNEIPHRRLPGSRRCLFREAELEQWEAGATLEVVELAGGGRIVRPTS
jgi:hypothetical protein